VLTPEGHLPPEGKASRCIFWTATCIFWTAICGFVLWDENQLYPSGIAMPHGNPKPSADERTFLNRLDCLNEEEIKQLTTRELFAYFRVIDNVDSRTDARPMVERTRRPGA
jgi:hypothetical protein